MAAQAEVRREDRGDGPWISVSCWKCSSWRYCFVATYVVTRPEGSLVSTAVIVLPLVDTVIVVTSMTVPLRLSVSSIVWELIFLSETAS